MSRDREFEVAQDGVWKTPPVLLRWPALIEPRPSRNPKQPPTYQATAVFDGTETRWLTGFRQFLENLCVQKHQMTIAQLQEVYGVDHIPVRRNSHPSRGRHAGIKERPNGIHFRAKTRFPLTADKIVDVHGRTMAGGRERELYDGCMVILAATFYPYDNKENQRRGIGISLVGLQKVGEGQPIASGGGDPDFAPTEEYHAPGFDPAANFNPGATASAAPQQPQTGNPPAAAPQTGGSNFW
jgi:hypothetical protein